VFAYLKARHAAHGAVLKALVEEGCRVLAYVPEVAAGGRPPLVSERVVYADAPLSLPQSLAEADLCVCHAGEATLAQSLLAEVSPDLQINLQQRSGQFPNGYRWHLTMLPYGGVREREEWPVGAYQISTEVEWEEGAGSRSYTLTTLRLGPKAVRQ